MISKLSLSQQITLLTAALIALVAAFLAPIKTVEAATLSLSPTTGVYTAGTPFSVRVVLNTQGQPINAAEALLSFNPKELRVQSVSQAGSIFNLWTIEPTFSNSAGTINFGGGSPRGYTGASGSIVTIQFVPQGSGTAKVTFTSGSALAADGQGTNVLNSMGSGSYTIAAQSAAAVPEEIEYVAPANTPAAPAITSSTHADPAGWYTNPTAELRWSLPGDITAVRTGLSSSPSSVPTVVYDPPISSRSLEELEQGVQYFHIQFKNNNGWGRVTHYRLAIDSEKPSVFNISLLEGEVGNPQPTLFFEVEDAASPVKKFIIQIDGGDAMEFESESDSSTTTYQLPALDPGRHSVVVEAFDAAGNSIVSTFAFDIASFEKPVFTDYPQRLSTDVVPVITGSTRPQSQVYISVTQSGASTLPVEYVVASDDSGTFTFIPDGSFERGVYDITAYSVDSFGAQSEAADPIRIVVAEPGLIQFGSLLVSALSIFIPLVALVLLLILGSLYLFRRITLIGGYVRRETKEAEASVVQSFARLRQVLDTHAKTLAASRKTKKLTSAESDLIESLRSELQEAERRVKKEVSDVDDIV